MLMPIPLFPGRGCRRRSADILRRGDFSDLREVPDEYTPDELRDAHNDLVKRLLPRRTVLLLAAAVMPAFLMSGVLTVETSRLGGLSNKSNVVTSVRWDGVDPVGPSGVREIVDSSLSGGTNAVNGTVLAVSSMSNSWNRAGRDATNYVDAATNAIRSVDGAARPLPKYLHLYEADDSYPEAAEEYYHFRGLAKMEGGCSAVRDGGFLFRNFDFPFDERAEFVVKMSAGKGRFASVGVAQVGTNLTEKIVTSGKPEYSHLYKWLPGATVDGVNENGIACIINVVDGDPQTSGWHNDTGDLHPLEAIRLTLDTATNAQHAAEYLASHIAFPQGWGQNFHYMIADETSTYIVENGTAHRVTNGVPAMTNFRLYGDPKDTVGEGQERYVALTNGANVTSQWWTLTYTANGYRASDLPGVTGESLTQLFSYWENNPRESHRGESFGDKVWRQTVHTSVYDITNRVLRVAVQEQDDWYVFQVPATVPKTDAYTKAETDALLGGKFDKSGGTVTGGATFAEGITATKKSTFTRGVDVTGGVDVSGAVKATSVDVTGDTANISVTSTASSGTPAGYRSSYGPDSWYIESGLDGTYAFFDFYDWWEFVIGNLDTSEEFYVELPRKDGTLATLDDIPAPQPAPDYSTNNVELVDTVKSVAGGHTLFVYATLSEVIVTAVKTDGSVVSRSAKGSGFYEENVVSCEIVHPGTDSLTFLRVNGGDANSSVIWYITSDGLLVGTYITSGASLRTTLATRRAAFTLTTDMALQIDFD